jgi:TP901 family phage tail tape measure protein
MDPIKVPITLDTTGYEAGLARIAQTSDAGLTKITHAANQASTAVSSFGQNYSKSFATWQTASRAQDEVARSATHMAEAYKSSQVSMTSSLSLQLAALQKVQQAGGAAVIAARQTQQAIQGALTSMIGGAANFASEYATNLKAVSQAFLEALPGVKALDHALAQFGLSLKSIGAVAGGVALFGSMAEGIKFAGDFEEAFTEVRRQVEFVGDEDISTAAKFDALGSSLKRIAGETGIAAASLAKVAAEAGHLGLRSVEDISEFTSVIAKMSVVTGVAGTQLAQSFSQLALQMGDTLLNAERMASTLIDLADHSRASEAQILDMATQIASLGRFIGLTTDQVLGLSAAFASVGAQPMAVNKVLYEMNQAVQDLSGSLDLFAKVAGKTSKEFAELFRTDAAKAITLFFQGIADHADEAVIIFDRLNLDGPRVAKTMIQMAQSTGEFDKSVSLLTEKLLIGRRAWEANTAAAEEFRIEMDSTWKQLGVLKIQIEEALITAFEGVLPVIRSVIDAFQDFIHLLNEHPMILKIAGAIVSLSAGFIGLGLAIGGLGLVWAGAIGGLASLLRGILAVTTAIVGAEGMTAAIVAFKAGIAGLSGAFATLHLAIGPAGWVTLGILAVAGAMYYFTTQTEAGAKAWTNFKEGMAGGVSPNFELGGEIGNIGPTTKKAAAELEDVAGEMSDFWIKTNRETSEALRNQDATGKKTVAQTKETLGLISKARQEAMAIDLAAETTRVQNTLTIQTAERQAALALGEITERDVQEQLLREAKVREDLAKIAHGNEMTRANEETENKKKAIAAAEQKYSQSMAAITAMRIAARGAIKKLDQEEAEEIAKNAVMRVDASEKAGQTIVENMKKVQREIEGIGLAPLDKTFKDFEDAGKDAGDALQLLIDKLDLTDAATAKLAYNASFQLYVKKTKLGLDELRKGLDESRGALEGMRETGGLEAWTVEYQKLYLAQTKAFKSYQDLTDVQKERIDSLAKTRAEIAANTLEEQRLKIVQDAAKVGLQELISMQDARLYQDTKRQEERVSNTLEVLDTLVNGERRIEAKLAESYKFRAQLEGNFYRFSLASLRGYANQLDSVWEGIARGLNNTFDAVQRTLSDVLFKAFTGESFKMKDIFKELLNSMYREIANFMSTQAVKGFLNFLLNMASGQTVGTAAQGALSGALGGSATGGGGGAGSGVGGYTGIAEGIFKLAGSLFGKPSAPTGFASIPSGVGGGLEGLSFGTGSAPFAQSVGYTSSFSAPSSSFSSDFSLPAYEFATGGPVPGSGRGDIVPAMLEPGEFVVQRSVAEQMMPALNLLNGSGGPTLSEGRFHFATGGVVPTVEAKSVTTDALLAAILVATNRQTTVTRVIAKNTEESSTTLGVIANETGATTTATPPWISSAATAGGEGASQSEIEALLNSGVISGGLRAVGSGASALGFTGAAQTVTGLAGIASLVQGVQQNNPYLMASGGLTAASSLAGILSNPQIAASLGLTPAQASAAGLAAQGLSAGTGIVGLVQGLQTGNTIQATAGGLQTAGSVANILASKEAAGLLGYSTGGGLSTVGGALGAAGGALGAAGGALTLYQGIQNENPSQIAIGAGTTALGAYSTLSAIAPSTFPALATLAADAAIAVAPATAASLGLVGSAGAAGAGAAGGAAAAGGASIGAAATGIGAVLAVGAIANYLFNSGGPLAYLSTHKPTSADISRTVSGIGVNQLNTYLQSQSGLQQLVQILYTRWAPHGEVKLGSSAFFGGQGGFAGETAIPDSENWLKALGALYTPELVGGGQGMPWVEEFVRGLTVNYGATGGTNKTDPAAVWLLQSKIAAALPDLPAYQGLKTAVMPGGDLFQAEQVRLAADAANLAAIPTPSYEGPSGLLVTPPAQNTYDPYTGLVTTPDGRSWLLSRQTIDDYNINPYTYDLHRATYGYGGYGGYGAPDASGISSDATGSSVGGIGSAGEGMALGGPVGPEQFQSQWGRDSVNTILEPGEWVIPRLIAAGNQDRLEHLVRTGQWNQDEDRMIQIPMGTPTVPDRPMTGDQPETAAPTIYVNVSVSGDIKDPRSKAAEIADALRDELRRRDARFSRAGNKTQA